MIAQFQSGCEETWNKFYFYFVDIK